MANTVLDDLAVTPTEFRDMSVLRSEGKSNFYGSGAVAKNGDIFMSKKGKFTHVPYTNDLADITEPDTDATPLVVTAFTDDELVAAVLHRRAGFGASDIYKSVSGSDPVKGLVSEVGNLWARAYDTTAISTLRGAQLEAGATLTNTSGAAWDKNDAIDTMAIRGDSMNDYKAVAVHPVTYASMLKDEIVTVGVRPSDGTQIQLYMGLEIIVNGAMPVNTGVYSTYFLKEGALAYNNSTPAEIMLEGDRDTLAGTSWFTTRSKFVMHPMGFAYDTANASIAGQFPSDAELALALQWDSKYADVRQMRFVALDHLNA